jgi:hypothetical protein
LQELERAAGEHDAPAVEDLLHEVTGGYHRSLSPCHRLCVVA